MAEDTITSGQNDTPNQQQENIPPAPTIRNSPEPQWEIAYEDFKAPMPPNSSIINE